VSTVSTIPNINEDDEDEDTEDNGTEAANEATLKQSGMKSNIRASRHTINVTSTSRNNTGMVQPFANSSSIGQSKNGDLSMSFTSTKKKIEDLSCDNRVQELDSGSSKTSVSKDRTRIRTASDIDLYDNPDVDLHTGNNRPNQLGHVNNMRNDISNVKNSAKYIHQDSDDNLNNCDDNNDNDDARSEQSENDTATQVHVM
jgi:hypothetical protein